MNCCLIWFTGVIALATIVNVWSSIGLWKVSRNNTRKAFLLSYFRFVIEEQKLPGHKMKIVDTVSEIIFPKEDKYLADIIEEVAKKSKNIQEEDKGPQASNVVKI